MYGTKILLLILIIFCVSKLSSCNCCPNETEALLSKPDKYARERMRSQILENPKLFTNDQIGIDKIKGDMPWVDPIVYEDVRGLILGGKLNKNNVDDILSK